MSTINNNKWIEAASRINRVVNSCKKRIQLDIAYDYCKRLMSRYNTYYSQNGVDHSLESHFERIFNNKLKSFGV